jgi:DinB superfamily
MDQAFEEDGEHSLLRNTASVPNEAWVWTPSGGSRNVRQIIGHVGACKFMYDNFAFGDSTMAWDHPAASIGASMEELQSTAALPHEPSRDAVLTWLREGHQRWRDNVAHLSDRNLLEPRLRPEGGTKEIRWIICVMVEHDLYHAGEINHLRALMTGSDRWAWLE